MIDPVQMGRVNAVVPRATRANLATQGAPAAMNGAIPSASAARAVTPLPRLLELAADLASAGAPLDYARIAQVRRVIADGEYQIDAGALADAIMRFGAQPRP